LGDIKKTGLSDIDGIHLTNTLKHSPPPMSPDLSAPEDREEIDVANKFIDKIKTIGSGSRQEEEEETPPLKKERKKREPKPIEEPGKTTYTFDELMAMDKRKLSSMAKRLFGKNSNKFLPTPASKEDYAANLEDYFTNPESFAHLKQESVMEKYKKILHGYKLESMPLTEKVEYLKNLLKD